MLGENVNDTAGDDAKLSKSFELGANHVFNHYKQKIAEEVRRITSKRGVDIVFEHVGSATWDDSVRSLRPGGTLVTCGATSGPEATFDIRVLFSRQLSFLGSYMGTMADFHAVIPHIFTGELKPVVDRTYPLNEVRAAHDRLQKSEQFGKIVLIP